MLPFSTQFLFSPLSFKANPDTIDCPYPIPSVPPALENASVVHNSTVSSGKKISECSSHEVPKKKRSRITKEQLVHLERFFVADPNPTTARRREISLQIEIPERQVRVWFQNRRAKAKSIGSLKSKTHRTASPLPPPPELGQATQVALATLLQEDDPSIFIIPCTCLTIGKWNRVSCNEWDLLAWFCETKRCLTWFVKSKAYSFKMQVALDWVGDLNFRNADPGRGILVLNLLRPPRFFLRKDLPSSDRDPPPYWRACDDWTEDNEASLGLRHVLEGPALPLAYIAGYIKDRKTNIKQFLPPPVVTYSTPSHSALSSSRDYCSGSLSRCHPMSSGWSATSGQENRHSNEPAPSFSSYPNSCISSFSAPMAPRGMPDSRLCNERTGFTGFTGVNTMSNPASTSPSPLPIPQLSYSSVQIPSGDRYLSPPLPGLSEIFSSTKYHQ